MTASVTLIVVGVFLLIGGDWPAAYGLACIALGALAWHLCAARARNALGPGAAPRVAAARKTLGLLAALLQVAAVLIAGACAFDHPQAGLFNGFSFAALLSAAGFGGGLLVAAAQLKAMGARLSEDSFAWLRRGAPHNP